MIYFRTGAVTVELLLLVGIAAALIEAFTRIGHSPASRSRMRAGDTMLYLTAFVFVGSGVSKFLHVDLAVVELTLLRLTGIKYGLVAALEILCGLLLLVRFLRSVALLVVSAHLGGAVCAHVIADQYFACLPTMIILSLCWLGAFLRHPQILWSLNEHARSAKSPAPRLEEIAG